MALTAQIALKALPHKDEDKGKAKTEALNVVRDEKSSLEE